MYKVSQKFTVEVPHVQRWTGTHKGDKIKHAICYMKKESSKNTVPINLIAHIVNIATSAKQEKNGKENARAERQKLGKKPMQYSSTYRNKITIQSDGKKFPI